MQYRFPLAASAPALLAWLMTVYLAGFYWVESARMHKLGFYAVLAGLLAALVIQPESRQRLGALRRHSVFIAVLVYLAIQLLTLTYSPIFSGEEMGELIRKSVLTLLFMAAVIVANLRVKHWLALVVLMAGSAAIGLAMGGNLTERFTSIGRSLNPVQSGIYFAIATVLTHWLIRQMHLPKWGYGLMIALSGLVFYALIATQSRGAMLGFVIASLILVMIRRKPEPARLSVIILTVMLSAVLALWLLPADASNWLARADGFRFGIWHSALQAMAGSPLLGLGYRTPFEYLLPYGDTVYQTHSIYIGALYAGGVLGLSALLGMKLTAGWQLWQGARKGDSLAELGLVLLLLSAIIGAFDFDILVVNSGMEWLVFWLPVALALKISKTA